MSNFVTDTFTDTNGTALTSHTGEIGATWAKQAGSGIVQIQSNTAVGTTSGATTFYTSGTAANSDYYVQASLIYNSNAGSFFGIGARMSPSAFTGYFLLYANPTGWQLYKCIAGTLTQLGSNVNQTLTPGTSYTMKLQCVGTTITASINGTQIISVTDTSISAAGQAGLYSNEAVSGSTGMALDNFSAVDGAGPLTAGTSSLASATTTTLTVTSTTAVGGASPYSYQWYRSTTPNFTPSAGNLLSGATSLPHVDSTGLSANAPYFYILEVTDSAAPTPATAQGNQIAGQLISGTASFGFIGDSITAGNGLSAGQDPVTQFGVLSSKLFGQLETINVSNQGQSGSSTGSWISGSADLNNAKTAFAAMSPVPTYIHVMLGTNDAAAHTSTATYQSHLTSMINDLVAAGYKIVLSYPIYTPAGANGGATDQAATALCLQYQPIIDGLINGTTVLRGDTLGYRYYIDNLTELQSDQTHPTALGAISLANFWVLAMNRIMNPAGGLLTHPGMLGRVNA